MTGKEKHFAEKYEERQKGLIIPFANLLSNDEVNLVEENSNIVFYKAQDVIFKQNTRTSHIMFIKSGLVKLFTENRNQKTKILKLGTPNEYLGLNSILGEETFSYSAVAVEETEIFIIDYSIFEQIVQGNGEFAYALLKYVSSSNLKLFSGLISQSQKQLPGRIADIILYFSDSIYDSEEFFFPLSRIELAELASTTKESLIRTLTEFKNDKIIKLDGRRVNIISKDIVKTLSRLG
jgi:CRP-like cAMP-binding protein